MHVTIGAVSRFRFENVCSPEQPLKLYPTVMAVTFSSGDTLKVIGVPWDVVPLHWPSSVAGDGVVGPQALINAQHAIATKREPAFEISRAAAPLRRRHPCLCTSMSGCRQIRRPSHGWTAPPVTAGFVDRPAAHTCCSAVIFPPGTRRVKPFHGWPDPSIPDRELGAKRATLPLDVVSGHVIERWRKDSSIEQVDIEALQARTC
jgi:hypothetical protein